MDTTVENLLRDKGSLVYSVSPNTSLLDCVSKMKDLKIGALMVVDNDTIKGIFTERDVLNKVISQALDLSAPVKQVMSENVVMVSLTTHISSIMKMMTENRFRHLPVVNDDKLVGLVSIGDVTRWIVESQAQEIQSLVDYINH